MLPKYAPTSHLMYQLRSKNVPFQFRLSDQQTDKMLGNEMSNK